MRLFIAITLDIQTRHGIGKVIEGLKPYMVGGRLTPTANLHFTLVFIGETRRSTAVMEAMDEVVVSPFTLVIENLGCFRRRGGDIYWLGVADNETLASIHCRLCTALAGKGFSLEKRPFKPHLTLGRELVFSEEFNRDDFQQTLNPLNMEVDKISLMRSQRLAGKIKYTEIYSRNLEARK